MGRDDSKELQKSSFLKINLSVVNKITESMGMSKKKTLNSFFSIISLFSLITKHSLRVISER